MISVLIPVYNAEKTIQRCLDSVIAQTLNDIEIIIVNDGSTDSTLEILDKYVESDKHIRIINQQNKGVASARNKGLQEARGEFFLYVDSDDWIEHNMLEKMSDLMNDADIVLCGCDHAENDRDVKHITGLEMMSWNQEQQLLEFMKHKHMTGMLWNKLIRRSIAVGCCFNEATGYGEDAEFLWQVLKNSKKMIVTNEILYHHTMEKSSISHLSFSAKKYSAIPMWEAINREVEQKYPELLLLARERLTSAAVFSLYECKKCGYNNKEQLKHMRTIARKNVKIFLKSDKISLKFKLYTIAVCLGY